MSRVMEEKGEMAPQIGVDIGDHPRETVAETAQQFDLPHSEIEKPEEQEEGGEPAL